MNKDPKGCFCKYSINKLADVARGKFVEHRSTIDLMESAKSETEKDEVAIVSLFDVDDETLVELMKNKLEDERCSVVSCRKMLKRQIEGMIKTKVV
ncbi:MAG: hypothetical protein IMF07_07400 [Proteobacteria bacterium]|nr:hypothetical protein [Pseudomonadota bacterium]